MAVAVGVALGVGVGVTVGKRMGDGTSVSVTIGPIATPIPLSSKLSMDDWSGICVARRGLRGKA